MDKFGLQNYILSLTGEQKETLYSWGFSNDILTENGLQFTVQGFLFNGLVVIVPNKETDTYSLRLKNTDGSIFAERNDIHCNELLSTIDSLVEKDCSLDGYQKLVTARYERQ